MSPVIGNLISCERQMGCDNSLIHNLLFSAQVLIEQDHYSTIDTHSHHPLFWVTALRWLFFISKCSLSQPTSSSLPLHFASPVHASIHIYRLQRPFASSLTNADSNSKGSPTLTHWVFVIVWMHLYIIYHLNNHLNTQTLAYIPHC